MVRNNQNTGFKGKHHVETMIFRVKFPPEKKNPDGFDRKCISEQEKKNRDDEFLSKSQTETQK